MTERQGHTPPWRGGPPPWWPAGQSWPPRRRRHRGPGFFFLRLASFLFFAYLLFTLFISGAGWLLGFALHPGEPQPVPIHPALGVLIMLGALFVLVNVVVRAVRTSTAPVGEVMEAAERVADGDYAVRVRPRGAREARRLADSFNAMVERLESAESQRRRLLADVTHELRTPLSVIQGQLEGALDGIYPRDDAHLSAILDEARHMSRLIDDLRVLSLAESGALKLVRGPVDLGEIVDGILDAYRGTADAAGVALRSDVPDDLPAADADATRVREVVENLVSNAIRYTPAQGSITVAARREGEAMLAVTVVDTGRGVPAEDLPHLFERFHKSPDSRGSGLGLAIARDLVRAHGGEIGASSEGEGRGTRVRFTLPVMT